MVLAGVASLLVLAVIAGLVALDQRGRARAEATAAAAQGLGAQALVGAGARPRAPARPPGPGARRLARTRAATCWPRCSRARRRSPCCAATATVTSVALSPDDRTLAFVDTDGTLRRLDARTLRPLARPQTVAGTSPTAGWTCASATTARGSRPEAARRSSSTPARSACTPGWHVEGVIYGPRFSPDGRTLFAIVDDYSGRYLVQRFDARSGRPLGEPVFVARARRTSPRCW